MSQREPPLTDNDSDIADSGSDKYQPVIIELIAALEQCLNDGIDWNSEQEADVAIRRAKAALKLS